MNENLEGYSPCRSGLPNESNHGGATRALLYCYFILTFVLTPELRVDHLPFFNCLNKKERCFQAIGWCKTLTPENHCG